MEILPQETLRLKEDGTITAIVDWEGGSQNIGKNTRIGEVTDRYDEQLVGDRECR